MYLLYVAITLVALMYLVAPLIVMFTLHHRAGMTAQPAGLSAVPPEALTFLTRTATNLATLGFESVGPFVTPPVGMAVSMVMLATHRGQGDTAVVVCTFTGQKAGAVQLKVSMVEFLSEAPDGRLVLTNNSPDPGAFPPGPGREVASLPGVLSPARLYRIHQARAAKLLGSQPRVVPQPEQELEFLSHHLERAWSDQVPNGMVMLTGGVYRPTLYGAYRMVWGELPPFRWIRMARRNAAARRVLAEFDHG